MVHLKKTLALSMTCALATVANASQPGPDVRPSATPSFHLMQLSVDYDPENVKAFHSATREIRSCPQARELAKTLSADVTENRSIRLSQLPIDLQDEVKSVETGHATRAFGPSKDKMRVLVVCSRFG